MIDKGGTMRGNNKIYKIAKLMVMGMLSMSILSYILGNLLVFYTHQHVYKKQTKIIYKNKEILQPLEVKEEYYQLR